MSFLLVRVDGSEEGVDGEDAARGHEEPVLGLELLAARGHDGARARQLLRDRLAHHHAKVHRVANQTRRAAAGSL